MESILHPIKKNEERYIFRTVRKIVIISDDFKEALETFEDTEASDEFLLTVYHSVSDDDSEEITKEDVTDKVHDHYYFRDCDEPIIASLEYEEERELIGFPHRDLQSVIGNR
jgi:hypothetical protein